VRSRSRPWETRPVDETTGFWRNPSDATQQSPCGGSTSISRAIRSLPASPGSRCAPPWCPKRCAGKGGAVAIRVIPAIKNAANMSSTRRGNGCFSSVFFRPLGAGSSAQLLEGHDSRQPARSSTNKGVSSRYMAKAALVSLNADDDVVFSVGR